MRYFMRFSFGLFAAGIVLAAGIMIYQSIGPDSTPRDSADQQGEASNK